MKILEACQKVDKSKPHEVSLDSLSLELGIDCDFDIESIETIFSDFRYYWLLNWYCTDTRVGIRVYYFKGELVAYSTQNARKNSEDFFWVSESNRKRVKTFLQSFLEIKEECLTLIDENEEIDEYYSLDFATQLLSCFHKNGVYEGKNVQVIRPVVTRLASTDVLISGEHEGDPPRTVNINQIKFPINITP